MKNKLSKKFILMNDTNYSINEYGEVKGLRTRIVLKYFLISNYPAVNISVNGKRKTCYVHHLMSLTFLNHTPKRGLITVNHIDQNKQNNRLDNLEIISHRRNSALTYIHRNRELPTGVSKNPVGIRRYKAQINHRGVNNYLGCYMTPQEASQIYQEACDGIIKTGEIPENLKNKKRYGRYKKD